MASNLPQPKSQFSGLEQASNPLLGTTVLVSVDEATPTADQVEGIIVDDAIAPNSSTSIPDAVEAEVGAGAAANDEPSDWWWDRQFSASSEERLGQYGF